MKKAALSVIALLATTMFFAGSTAAAGGITLWKEYPAQYYPNKKGVFKMAEFHSPQACHDAMMIQINSQRNFGSNIWFYCL